MSRTESQWQSPAGKDVSGRDLTGKVAHRAPVAERLNSLLPAVNRRECQLPRQLLVAPTVQHRLQPRAPDTGSRPNPSATTLESPTSDEEYLHYPRQ